MKKLLVFGLFFILLTGCRKPKPCPSCVTYEVSESLVTIERVSGPVQPDTDIRWTEEELK